MSPQNRQGWEAVIRDDSEIPSHDQTYRVATKTARVITSLRDHVHDAEVLDVVVLDDEAAYVVMFHSSIDLDVDELFNEWDDLTQLEQMDIHLGPSMEEENRRY